LESRGLDCLVPVLDRQGHLTGLLALGPRRSEEPYSGEDKRLLAGVAAQAGITLESFALAEEIAHKLEKERRLAYEMEIAHKVQTHLFPHQAQPLESLEYEARCVQARAVGGDFYDYLNLGTRRLGLVLADISGKGISAALLMANLQATLRSRAVDLLGNLEGVMLEINRSLFANTEAQQFATLFYMEYDDATGRARYVNCGHNPPLCLRQSGRIDRLPATATLLGAFESWECKVAELLLQPGDLLLAYSDGVTETRSRQAELFGEDRLIAVLRAHQHAAVSDIVQAVTSAVGHFGSNGPEDDLTLLVARARAAHRFPSSAEGP
jgi:serine phosphatase RsbU (regulator of sigma subunit)